MNILEEIILNKKKEIAERKQKVSAAALEASPFFGRTGLSLKAALNDAAGTGIIAEFKRKSPSKGVINGHVTVETVTGAYTTHGAAGISVLTDEPYFGGTTADLVKARNNRIPILRKDFMVDAYQLSEAKAMGADVILLIAAALSPAEVAKMAGLAHELGLEVLLEIHNEDELQHICDSVDMVGVNNRNLKTFEVDIQTSIDLFEHIPNHIPAVSESGIADVETILKLRSVGFKGFLIGENFMKQTDPAIAFADFVDQLKARS